MVPASNAGQCPGPSHAPGAVGGNAVLEMLGARLGGQWNWYACTHAHTSVAIYCLWLRFCSCVECRRRPPHTHTRHHLHYQCLRYGAGCAGCPLHLPGGQGSKVPLKMRHRSYTESKTKVYYGVSDSVVPCPLPNAACIRVLPYSHRTPCIPPPVCTYIIQ